MEHVKKMILVDPRMMDTIRSEGGGGRPPVPDATSHSLLEMDREMQNALDKNDINLQDKARLYQQVLWRYLKRFEQYRDKPLGTVTLKRPLNTFPEPAASTTDETVGAATTSPPQPRGRLEEEVLDSVPKSLKKKAERLLQRLHQHPQLKWNSQGEIEYEGQLVKNSNLVDLVNDVLRKRRNFEPEGWKTFATALRRVNMPQDLIGHPDRWDFMRSQITTAAPTPLQLSTVPEPAVREGGQADDGFTEVLSKKTRRRKRKLSQVQNWTNY